MNKGISKKRQFGMTLIDLLIVIVVLGLLAAMVMPALIKMKQHDQRIGCINNLKQIGLAYRVWDGDHGGRYPMGVPETNGGTMEFATGPNAWRHFQVMSNELSTPVILVCPTDSSRWTATNFASLRNLNLSYFAGVDVSNEVNPQMILSGDRNITNGNPIKNGILEISPNKPAGWTSDMHGRYGNLLMADGSCQQVANGGLRAAIADSSNAVSRLQMPVLNQ